VSEIGRPRNGRGARAGEGRGWSRRIAGDSARPPTDARRRVGTSHCGTRMPTAQWRRHEQHAAPSVRRPASSWTVGPAGERPSRGPAHSTCQTLNSIQHQRSAERRVYRARPIEPRGPEASGGTLAASGPGRRPLAAHARLQSLSAFKIAKSHRGEAAGVISTRTA